MLKKYTTLLLLLAITISGKAQLNYLDSTFQGTGIKQYPFTASNRSKISTMKMTPDGKVVVRVLTAPSSNNSNIDVYRFTMDGTPDESFGTGGKVNVQNNVIWSNSWQNAMEVLPNNKILIGYSYTTLVYDTVYSIIVRLNENGTFDPAFGVNGIVRLGYPVSIATVGHSPVLVDFKIKSNGGITLIYNSTGYIAYTDYGFRYLTADGHPAPGDIGIMWWQTDNYGEHYAGAIIQPNDFIVTGSTQSPSNGQAAQNQFLLERFETDGYISESFGNQGFTLTDLTSGDDNMRFLTEQENHTLLAGGYSTNIGGLLAKYTSDGNPDPTFGINGKSITPVIGFADGVSRMRVSQQSIDKKFAITGDKYPVTPYRQGAVIRFTPNGFPDTLFSPSGQVYLPYTDLQFQTYMNDILMLPDRRMLVCGTAEKDSVKQLFIARLLPEADATVWYHDTDGDTYGNATDSIFSVVQLSGYVATSGDCDDHNAAVHPGAAENCTNFIDDNCNGVIDEDSEPPVAVCNTQFIISLDENGVAALPWLVLDNGSYDACGGPLTISNAGDTIFLDCSLVGSIYTTGIFILDASFNFATCSADITVIDALPPTAHCVDSLTILLNNSGIVTLNSAMINENSTDNCNISGMEVTPSQLTAASLGYSTVQLTVTDPSGNSSNCQAVVHLIQTSGTETAFATSNWLRLSPNPVKDQLHIQLADVPELQQASLSVLDEQGRILRTIHTTQTTVTLDVADLPSGNYYMQVTGKNGKVLMGKFAK